MSNFKTICMLACFLSALSVAAQQVRPRIAGLEGNAAYMSLLAEDGRLQPGGFRGAGRRAHAPAIA